MQIKSRVPGFIASADNASSFGLKYAGSWSSSSIDKIVPAGSWCCQIRGPGGRVMHCSKYLRTNIAFAGIGCGAEAAQRGGSSNLIPCPQDDSCCRAVGCVAKYTPIIDRGGVWAP